MADTMSVIHLLRLFHDALARVASVLKPHLCYVFYTVAIFYGVAPGMRLTH